MYDTNAYAYDTDISLGRTCWYSYLRSSKHLVMSTTNHARQTVNMPRPTNLHRVGPHRGNIDRC